jgi:hypothetical protein
MENWHPSIVSEVNAQRQADRRALSAHRAQRQAVAPPAVPLRAALAGLLVALASRLDPTGALAHPPSAAPAPSALA